MVQSETTWSPNLTMNEGKAENSEYSMQCLVTFKNQRKKGTSAIARIDRHCRNSIHRPFTAAGFDCVALSAACTPSAIEVKKASSTHMSNFRLAYRLLLQLALAVVVSTPALAGGGQIYSPEQILAFSVADLKIGIPAGDAERFVSEAGYEGGFPATIEEKKTSGQWVKFDRAVFLFRYIDAAGTTRLWRIRFGQKFYVPQSIDLLRKKVIEKYGEPSEIDGTNGDLVYHTQFKLDHGIARTCYASGSPSCWDTAMMGTKYRQSAEMEAAYVAEVESPEMRVSITPTTMYVDLRSFDLASDSERRRNQAAASAIEKKRIENAKHLDLGF
jgi:hypothetical protein